MKRLAGITISILLVLGTSCLAEAVLIGSVADQSTGGSYGVFTSFDVDIEYQHTVLNPIIFDVLTVSETDIGTEFFATSSSGSNPDPGFDDFANYITNGTDQAFTISTSGSGSNKNESIWFGTSPDFQGYTIDKFGIKINDVSFESPGSDPNGDGEWTSYYWNAMFNVYGSPTSVPEPATMLLLGSGLIGLVGFRRKFKK